MRKENETIEIIGVVEKGAECPFIIEEKTKETYSFSSTFVNEGIISIGKKYKLTGIIGFADICMNGHPFDVKSFVEIH